MASPLRNIVGGHSRALDPFESAVPQSASGLAGMQPLGQMVGKQFGSDYDRFLNGMFWDKNETGTGTAVITDSDATNPPIWTLTTGGTGSDTIAIDSMTGATLDSATQSAWSPFICKSGFNIYMSARFKVTSTVANAAFLIGLKKAGAALGSAAIAVDDFVGFNMPHTTAAMVGTVRTSDTGTATSTLQTVVIDTWYDLLMRVNGRSSVEFWVNGVRTGQTTMTNLPANTVKLALGCAVATNATAAAVLVLQRLVAFQEAI